MNTDDQHLLNQLKQSALDAFQCLFEKYQPLLFKYLYYRTKDESLSQDIVQETFLKVWLKRATIKANASFWAYLVKISENLIKDHYKRKAVREKHRESIGAVHESVYDNPEAAYHFNVLQREINDAANKHLPPKCRQIFILSRIDGKSNREITELLNISLKTVENQLYHALKVLRKKLRKYLYTMNGHN